MAGIHILIIAVCLEQIDFCPHSQNELQNVELYRTEGIASDGKLFCICNQADDMTRMCIIQIGITIR